MYKINVIDTKTDAFAQIETEGTTFGDIKQQLIDNGIEVDFKKRAYVISETNTEIIGDDSQLGCCDSATELTLCVYPKDTKAGLSNEEIDALGFAGMRRQVSALKVEDKAGWDKHLSHLGGNPSNQGLKDALKAYYGGSGKAAPSPKQETAKAESSKTATATATPAPSKSNAPKSGASNASLEERVAALENAVFGGAQVADVVESVKEAKVDPEEEAKKQREAAKQAAIKKAQEIRNKAQKKF